MRDVLLTDAIVLDEPAISLAWTSTFDDAVALLAGRGCDRASRRCVLRDVVFAGVAFARATLSFDARGCLAHARFEPPPDPIDPRDPEGSMPEDVEKQLQRHGPSILARRTKLETVLGPGTPSPRAYAGLCPDMTFGSGTTRALHHVMFCVERGGDVEGWLEDEVEVTRAD